MRKFFTAFANKTSRAVGSHWAFLIALLIVLIWGATGPMFHYSDTWQLVINTGTTIITFLMVFLIQNTQNRDAKAMHLKLDELITAVKAAHNEMIDIEELNDEQLEEIAKFYRKKKEEYGEDEVTALASAVAEEEAHETAREVADTAKRAVEDHENGKRRVA
ncbi:MAG TPA: low affinity iron permease family protein [Blastocatellia bacterium]|nr:low affinity iron permease family protein [Blastocatellia bacterium]